MPPVVLMMLDGLRPDALTQANTPRLDAFMREGAYTLAARSVSPSITLPCHTSIFHSIPPSRHGILDNAWHSMVRPVVGLVDVAKTAGKRCAFFYNWEPLRDLNRPENLHFAFYVNTCYEPDGDRPVVEAAVRYLPEYSFDFTFIYFGLIDTAGHYYGWMTDGYMHQIEMTDAYIGMILDVLPPETTVIIHADHGGHERIHGTDMPEDMIIPWMIGGAGVRRGHVIQQPVTLLDTAPTIAHLLGIQRPTDWEGSVVAEAFES
ncbi:MAG: alkaline phosphatase family protein [Anaerolineae bacterium]